MEINSNRIVENQNIFLRRFQKSDVNDLFELDSDIEVLKYIHVQPAENLEEIRTKIAQVEQQYQENGLGRLAIIRKSDEAFLGWAGLKYETEIREFPYYDIGYRLLRKFWRKGYGIQAAKLSLEYGFNDLKLDKICAAADVENIGSNKILNQIGMKQKDPFQFEGINCKWYELKREDYDQGKN